MSKRESNIPLRHMLDHAREAYALIQNRSREDIEADRLLNLALVRLMEIIGEAAGRVPSEERIHYPGIPWLQIIGMRNRLIHGYDTVNFDILWQTMIEDLPPLIATLEKILLSGNERA
jgi:uncharacterized protein with HEPN domain